MGDIPHQFQGQKVNVKAT